MGTAMSKKNKLLPFALIEAATTGNVTAINAVLKHFEQYINGIFIYCNDNPLQYSCLENPMDGGAW